MFTNVFFFDGAEPTEIYTLSLHDALPISRRARRQAVREFVCDVAGVGGRDAEVQVRSGLSNEGAGSVRQVRSEEHTSELQSRLHLVCRLLLEKKNKHRKLASLLALSNAFT